jgi:WD40 repeat protein
MLKSTYKIVRYSLIVLFFISELSIAQESSDILPYLVLKKQQGSILSLAFQPDGKVLVSGSEDKSCVFWSFPEGKVISGISGLINSAKVVQFTPDSKYFLVAVERGIRVYYPNGEFVKPLGGPATHIWSFSYNPQLNRIVTGSYDKNIRIIDFSSGKIITVTGHLQNALAVRYSPDYKMFASGSLDESLKIWDAATNQLIYTFTGHGSNIYDVLFTPDSKKVISASNDNSIKIWDIDSRKWEKNLLGNESAIFCIAISADGYYLVSGAYDGTVKLWDILRNECIQTINEHIGQVNAVVFSPDGKYFVTAGNDKNIMVWEMKPEIFVQKYYSELFKNELENSELFLPKTKEETKDVYKIRQEKCKAFKGELFNKYYNRYLTEIKGKK